MSSERRCLVCRSLLPERGEQPHGPDAFSVECTICGSYVITKSAYAMLAYPRDLSKTTRAALSHALRRAQLERQTVPEIQSAWLHEFLKDPRRPSPAVQAINALRYLGDLITETGERVKNIPQGFYTIIGAPNAEKSEELLLELEQKGFLKGKQRPAMGPDPQLRNIDLTLDGWDKYEQEKRGKLVGQVGFLALKFGEPELDRLVSEALKPGIEAELRYQLVDMRDVPRAGIIDNIMRAQIRDAAFVIADLTHDNPGAYWEAGYAEGLGKPVIYICERQKFSEQRTHFDTNHCTTVFWTADDHPTFVREMVATLRRSLNLFES